MKACTVVLMGLLPLLPLAAGAQAGRPDERGELAVRLDSIVRAALHTSPIVGVSVAVVRGSDTLLHRGYGLADLGLGAPTTLHTTYRLVFPTAAIGIMQQVESERIRLDDDASRILSELDWQDRRVTIRQLLDGTSGLPDYHYLGDAQKLQRSVPQSRLDVANLFMGRPYVHQPGAAWSFTISGFHLAGMVLERITERPYEEYVREHIIARAGLQRTFYCPDGAVTPGLATGYYYASGNRFELAPYHAPSHYAFVTTVCTNATDAIALFRALRDGRLMGAATYREMTRAVGPARQADGGIARGVGVRIGDEGGHRWVGERFFLMGYNTSVLDFPDDSLTVAVLQNTFRPRAVTGSRIARELARAALGLPPLSPFAVAPEEPLPVGRSLAASERARYHGTYDVSWAGGPSPLSVWRGAYRVYDEAGRLMFHMPGVPPEPLVHLREHTFGLMSDHEMRITFTVVEGRATALEARAGPNAVRGPRRADRR